MYEKSLIILGKTHLAYGYKDDLTIDRINNDGNYEPSNCRWTTKTIQSRNTKIIQSNNTSGFRGVLWNKDSKKWQASITVNYKNIHLGLFDDISLSVPDNIDELTDPDNLLAFPETIELIVELVILFPLPPTMLHAKFEPLFP